MRRERTPFLMQLLVTEVVAFVLTVCVCGAFGLDSMLSLLVSSAATTLAGFIATALLLAHL